MTGMIWLQKEIVLQPRGRGIHLITDEILAELPQIGEVECGLLHLMLMHTSAAIALNEGVEPEVRGDLARFLDQLAPEGPSLYAHNYEGPDDMPAHIKSVLVGAQLTLPVTAGAVNLGTWQGLYLCEFRAHGGLRRLLGTLNGTSRS